MIFLLLLLPFGLSAKEDATFFAKVTQQPEGSLIEGDSLLVTVWIYSVHPFDNVQCKDEKVKMGNCSVRQTYAARGRQRQQRAYVNGRSYYCSAVRQYCVGSSRTGEYQFPELSFRATVYVEQKQDIDPFDPFGFFSQPVYKKAEKACVSPVHKITVTKRPLKSTEELIKSGKTVI